MKFYKVYVTIVESNYQYVVLVVTENDDVDEHINNWADKNDIPESCTVVIDDYYDITDRVPVEFYGYTKGSTLVEYQNTIEMGEFESTFTPAKDAYIPNLRFQVDEVARALMLSARWGNLDSIDASVVRRAQLYIEGWQATLRDKD